MRIDIVWGESEGKTLLSAFDRALLNAGIHNFNLISLNSVIPPNQSSMKQVHIHHLIE